MTPLEALYLCKIQGEIVGEGRKREMREALYLQNCIMGKNFNNLKSNVGVIFSVE